MLIIISKKYLKENSMAVAHLITPSYLLGMNMRVLGSRVEGLDRSFRSLRG